jgi:hypothetical protein
MAARARYNGHPVTYAAGGWRYDDTWELVSYARPRPCPSCHRNPTPEGHDACLGTLPGVTHACCGHGDPSEAYVRFEDGTELRGKPPR